MPDPLFEPLHYDARLGKLCKGDTPSCGTCLLLAHLAACRAALETVIAAESERRAPNTEVLAICVAALAEGPDA